MKTLRKIDFQGANRSVCRSSLRYRFFLEQNNVAPSTINVRLAAVRCLDYKASDTGLAAGFRRVKGAKRLGVRNGNWLTIDQSRSLFGSPLDSLRGKRDRAILALLIGCGLLRAELVGLRTGDFQVRKIIFARDPGSISQWFFAVQVSGHRSLPSDGASGPQITSRPLT